MKLGNQSRNAGWSIVALTALVFVVFGAMSGERGPHGASKLSSLPNVFLWAWERPEKFDFIDPKKVGVAFLAKTISLQGDNVTVRPRLQSLSVPPETSMIAVARIEVDRRDPPSLSEAQLTTMVAEIAELSDLPNIAAVQIDFDAKRSQRQFYRTLIFQVRERLPLSMPLSLTALGSWCGHDNWLSVVPVDEAVPMLFRMGIERRQILSQLEMDGNFNSMPCQASAGVSVDEPVSVGLERRRLYIFNPQPWSPVSFKAAMETYHR